MRRRDKTGGKLVKAQRTKTLKRRSSSVQETDVARLSRELSEAFEQQAATADILNIISNSPADAQPVFDAIVQSGLKLFPDALISLALRYGDTINAAAIAERDPEGAEAWRRSISRTPLSREYMHGAAMLDCRIVDIPDVRNAPTELAAGARNFLTSGYRAITITPMMRRNEAIGLLSVVRRTPGPLSDKQLSLLRTFAAQAVIAIENTRLLNELRQRTDDLTESLEQQTATSEVLKVISTSPTEIQPVLDAVGQNAARLCEATNAVIFRLDGNLLRPAAVYGEIPLATHPPEGLPVTRDTVTGRAVFERRTIHVRDLASEQDEYPEGSRHAAIDGHRTTLATPLLRKGVPVGAILIRRTEVRPFSPKQIDLITTFADQAAIAIENVRLFNELRQRTDDLSESLQQQTATADVLKVISRSTFDLESVLGTLTGSAAGLCKADKGAIFQKDGDVYRLAAHFGFSPEEEQQAKQYAHEQALEAGRGSLVGRVALGGHVVHIKDVLADPDYQANVYQKAFRFRTDLGVPLLREGSVIGVFALMRTEVNVFSEKEIDLVATFADQAVIAIENARLLNELRESLQQQTATADVLKVISRSTFDLGTVLQTLVESVARLCDADRSVITRERNGTFYRSETYGFSQEWKEYVKDIPIKAERGSAFGRALLEGRAVQIADASADPEYMMHEVQRLGDYRTILAVPMLREGNPIGVVSLVRKDVRPFTDKQIELASTFADQAAIAIENVRLFENVEARTRDLAASLDNLRATQDRLVQTQKLASLGQLTAGIAHEIKNPLNFVNNFSGISVELVTELQESLADLKSW